MRSSAWKWRWALRGAPGHIGAAEIDEPHFPRLEIDQARIDLVVDDALAAFLPFQCLSPIANGGKFSLHDAKQTPLERYIPKSPGLILCFQGLNFTSVMIESIEVGKYHISLYLSWIANTQVPGIGIHSIDRCAKIFRGRPQRNGIAG